MQTEGVCTFGNNQWRVRVLLEILAGNSSILSLHPEVQFHRQRLIHLSRQPLKIIFREKAFEHRESEPSQRQVKRHPLSKRRMLHFDCNFLPGLLQRGNVHLGEGGCTDRRGLERTEQLVNCLAGVGDEHLCN